MIAVIGGSGFASISGATVHQEHACTSQYGAPSDAVSEVDIEGRRTLFLSRHGGEKSIAPHRVNYRANLWAVHQLGAKQVIAVNACGGINTQFSAGDLAVPKQIIDYSFGRETSFYDGVMEPLQHIDFTHPFSESLRQRLLQAAAVSERTVHDFGVYGCTQGPRLETAAEIQRLKKDGCDLVGMTAMPEAVLARELGMEYASICMIVNPAAGISSDTLSIDDIYQLCREMAKDTQDVIVAAITHDDGSESSP